MKARLVVAGLALLVSSCSTGLLSGELFPSREAPVARIETTGGVEFGATTREGILFLGRTAQSGPCRVLHLIGPSPSVEDGVIEHKGGVFYIADMDLKHQNIPILPRQLRPEDELVAMFLDGIEVKQMPVQLANDPDVQGDVLVWPAK